MRPSEGLLCWKRRTKSRFKSHSIRATFNQAHVPVDPPLLWFQVRMENGECIGNIDFQQNHNPALVSVVLQQRSANLLQEAKYFSKIEL